MTMPARSLRSPRRRGFPLLFPGETPPPVVIEALPLRPKIIYVRKSTEAADAQALSHNRQLEEIHKRYPPTEFARTWRDSKSGATFDRPKIREMLAWCDDHPQDHDAPGTIVMWAVDRFGRPLIPGTDDTDWNTWDLARVAFSFAGWELEFITLPKTGIPHIDRLMRDHQAEQGADWLRKMKRDTGSGHRRAFDAGYWPFGIVPFPCRRKNAHTGDVLEDAARDEHGVVIRDEEGMPRRPSDKVQRDCHVVLDGEPVKVPHWNHGAHMLLNREPWRAVQRYYDKHVRTARGYSRWTREAIMGIYQNEALIGWMVRRWDRVVHRVRAKWDPIVDPELFAAVQAEIARREAEDPQRRERRPESTYVIRDMRCAHCGARYVGGFRKGGGARAGGRRYYTHPEVDVAGRLDRETETRGRACGCRTYRIPADAAEIALRDVILAERGSENWFPAMRRLLDNADGQRSEADRLVTLCEERRREKAAELATVTKALDKANDATFGIVLARIETKQQELAEAERDLAAATARRLSSSAARERALSLVKETEQIAKAWDSADAAARQRILDWWVDGVEIAVEQVPGRTRGTVLQKTLLVWLRMTPDDPRAAILPSFERGRGETTLRMAGATSSRRSRPSGRAGSRPGAAP